MEAIFLKKDAFNGYEDSNSALSRRFWPHFAQTVSLIITAQPNTKIVLVLLDPVLPSGVLSRLALAASPTATRKLLHLKIDS